MEPCELKELHVKRTLSCQITVHLSRARSEVTCLNEQHRENVKQLGILYLEQVVTLFISHQTRMYAGK
jgi:hypothetical protein